MINTSRKHLVTISIILPIWVWASSVIHGSFIQIYSFRLSFPLQNAPLQLSTYFWVLATSLIHGSFIQIYSFWISLQTFLCKSKLFVISIIKKNYFCSIYVKCCFLNTHLKFIYGYSLFQALLIFYLLLHNFALMYFVFFVCFSTMEINLILILFWTTLIHFTHTKHWWQVGNYTPFAILEAVILILFLFISRTVLKTRP